jgi:hypothetical protein
MIIVISLIGVAILGIVFIRLGAYSHEGLMVLGICMVFCGVPAFVGVSIEKDITRKYIQTDVEVRFTSRSAIIDDGIKIRTYDDFETVNELKDTTLVFYREETTNFWGHTIRSERLFWGKGDKCDECEPL